MSSSPGSMWTAPVPKLSTDPNSNKDPPSKSQDINSNAAGVQDSVSATQGQQETHRDGIQHLKEHTTNEPQRQQQEEQKSSASHLQSSAAAVPESAGYGHPPASNPSANDPSGGIEKGHGGVSGAAYAGSPVTGDDAEQPSILGTVKNYLGLSQGGEAAAATSTTHDTADDSKNDSTAQRSYVAAAGAAVASTAAAVQERVSSATTNAGTTSEGGSQNKETYLNYSSNSSSSQPNQSTLVDRTVETVKQATTGIVGSSSSDNSNDKDSQDKMADSGNDGKSENQTPGGTQKPGVARENPGSIPVAGGERLGEKHWGESKIVPDNPKPAESIGVSSPEGQPTDETKANTAHNTGPSSSSGGGGSSEHAKTDEGREGGGKTKVVDKIKDKLHIGSKKDKE